MLRLDTPKAKSPTKDPKPITVKSRQQKSFLASLRVLKFLQKFRLAHPSKAKVKHQRAEQRSAQHSFPRLFLFDADKLLWARIQHVAELPGGQVDPNPDHSAPISSIPESHHGAIPYRVRHAAELHGVLDHNDRILRHQLYCWSVLPMLLTMAVMESTPRARRGRAGGRGKEGWLDAEVHGRASAISGVLAAFKRWVGKSKNGQT